MPPQLVRRWSQFRQDATFRFPTEEVLAANHAATRLIAVANPNNPTGAFVSSLGSDQHRQSCARSGVAGRRSLLRILRRDHDARNGAKYPNLFVSRTFSKAYGMAGLANRRADGQRRQMRWLRRNSSPYNLNSVALACLPDALADQDYIRITLSKRCDGRARLESELAGMGHSIIGRAAQILFFSILGERCNEFISAMRARGILVRDRSSDPGCQDCVRITVGSASTISG